MDEQKEEAILKQEHFSVNKQRTIKCGDLQLKHVDSVVTINGWVHRFRDHGGVYFINVRDRYGIVQVVIDEESSPQAIELVKDVHVEYCISIVGKVRLRPKEMINADMKTGEIEIHVQDVFVFSKSRVLPFMVEEGQSSANEDLRLAYRYLDLRSTAMSAMLALRHEVSQSIRTFLNKQDFLEIETPTLIRSTPEGARDFLVPSRIIPGQFYALAQSPQLYKQILMIGGMDRYYQFAHCYRDEDARGDRQPEHTQIDMEMSFVCEEGILSLTEELMRTVFSETLSVSLPSQFTQMTYESAMEKYGTDRPDVRYELFLKDFGEYAKDSGFSIFENALEAGGVVKLLVVPNASDVISRKAIAELEADAIAQGAKGLAWAKYANGSFSGGIGGFLSRAFEEYSTKLLDLIKRYNISDGDVLFFVADMRLVACRALGTIRKKIATMLNLIKDSQFSFAWVTDFPLFEWDDDKQMWIASHHMFSMPQLQYIDSFEENPADVKGQLYDLVCNGVELASGSIRIHRRDIQERVFSLLGMSPERMQARFGFLLKALTYGAPPHGGIAPGIDRLLMIMSGNKTIRDCIAFPKNTQGASPMDGCPSEVDNLQLEELHLKIDHSK